MRFFDRKEEIASLKEILELSKSNAQFTVVTGRRRIGKTSLVWKAYENEPILYFFVARKAESDLCADYIHEIENKLGIPTMGRANPLILWDAAHRRCGGCGLTVKWIWQPPMT